MRTGGAIGIAVVFFLDDVGVFDEGEPEDGSLISAFDAMVLFSNTIGRSYVI